MLIFLLSYTALLNPSEKSIISAISCKSAAIIDIGLNNDFRLSGNSDLPAYPGFIVIKIPQPILRGIVAPSKLNDVLFSLIADWILAIYWAITLKTSSKILLNSSRQPHAPDYANPEKSLPKDVKSIDSEQFITITNLAIFFPKSLTVSVFPVPAGPYGAPPLLRYNAVVKVT